MRNYIVIVRSYTGNQPSDAYLYALDRYYKSPVVKLDLESNWDKAVDVFDRKYRKHFSHFLYLHYTFVPV